jgi:hypothetical protein
MTEHDLGWDIHDLSQAAENIAEAWADPILRRQIEAEQDCILSAIETIRQLFARDEQAEIRRLSEERRALRERSVA